MYLDKYIDKTGISSNYPIFSNNISVKKTIATNDLFLSQFIENKFNAIDVVVKYLAIENFYNLNNFGFKLYEKMQKYRINENWNEKFNYLINSFEKDGYNNDSYIQTDLNYSIHDGAHRLALCLFFNIPYINLEIFNTFKSRRPYDISWFEENNFSKYEIDIINNKLNELLIKCQIPYISFIWPPAENIRNNIISSIEETFNPNINIVENHHLKINSNLFDVFLYEIYKIDDIKLENFKKKLNFIKNSMNSDNILNNNIFNFSLLKFNILNPDFRLKPISGLPQSKETMNIKKYIRNKFKNKITDYQYDIIIHITDNQIQNNLTNNIINKYFNLEDK